MIEIPTVFLYKKDILETIEFNELLTLREAFDTAFSEVPGAYRDTVFLRDGALCYIRPENDKEYTSRIEREKTAVERAYAMQAAEEKSHLENELIESVRKMLEDINNNWSKMEIGGICTMGASVPMYDGRQANIMINVTVSEEKVSE